MKTLVALLLGSSLAGCCAFGVNCPAPPPPYADYQVALDGVNDAGDLCCLLNDSLPGGPQNLLKGQSGRGEDPRWYTNTFNGDSLSNDKLEMVLKAPPYPGVDDTVSMGAFRPNLDFGRDSAFTLRATFEYPDSVTVGKGWAFAIVARTGDAEHDTPDLSRVQVSARVRQPDPVKMRPRDIDIRFQEVDGDKVNTLTIYNAPEGSAEYNAIKAGQPVTLKLVLNRKAGIGSAYVTIGTIVKSLENFPLTVFGVNSAPPLTAAGVALATDSDWQDADGHGEIRVQVTDFRICVTENNC